MSTAENRAACRLQRGRAEKSTDVNAVLAGRRLFLRRFLFHRRGGRLNAKG